MIIAISTNVNEKLRVFRPFSLKLFLSIILVEFIYLDIINWNYFRKKIQMCRRILSVLERAKLVCWFEETNSLAVVARRYRAEFGVDPPALAQIKRIHREFLQTGSVLGGAVPKDQCANSAVEAILLRKNAQLSSIEAQQMSQLAMKKGPIERFA
jgi:hypothetical protein